MRVVIRHAAVLAAAAIVLTAARAEATVLTFALDAEYSGAAAPAGAGPWLTVTFDDGGSAGSVTFSVTADLAPGEFVGSLLLNLNPALNASNLLAYPPQQGGTFGTPLLGAGNDAFSAGGGSAFDLRIEFDSAPPGDRFGGSDSVTYVLSGIPSLTADDFAFLSTGGGIGGLPVAAHVQGVGPRAADSGWVTVPEPSSAALLPLGGIALLRRRRRPGIGRA